VVNEHQAFAWRLAAHASHQIRPARRGLDYFARNAFAGQHALEETRRDELVAGRVGRVEANVAREQTLELRRIAGTSSAIARGHSGSAAGSALATRTTGAAVGATGALSSPLAAVVGVAGGPQAVRAKRASSARTRFK
jgi:hypothetical protein